DRVNRYTPLAGRKESADKPIDWRVYDNAGSILRVRDTLTRTDLRVRHLRNPRQIDPDPRLSALTAVVRFGGHYFAGVLMGPAEKSQRKRESCIPKWRFIFPRDGVVDRNFIDPFLAGWHPKDQCSVVIFSLETQ